MKSVRMKSMVSVGVLTGVLLMNVGAASASSQLWEKAECDERVEAKVASAPRAEIEPTQPKGEKVLLASCEGEKRSAEEAPFVPRDDMRMFRGKSWRF